MGTKLQNAAEAIQRVSRDYQAVIDLAAELGRIGDIEAAEENANRRLAQARFDLTSVMDQLSEARNSLLKVADEAQQKIVDAQAQANGIVSKAQEESIAYQVKMREQADTLVAAAKDEIIARGATADKDIADARAKDVADGVARAEDLKSVKQAVADTTALLSKKQTELATVEARIAQIHESMSNLSRAA